MGDLTQFVLARAATVCKLIFMVSFCVGRSAICSNKIFKKYGTIEWKSMLIVYNSKTK